MSKKKGKIGFLAGAFDLLHPGYIAAFHEAKQHCDYLIVGLHDDPTLERPEKIPPIIPTNLREKALRECRSIDDVQRYNTEGDLVELLKRLKPDIRFLGDDYKNAKITGAELNIPIIFLDRSHGYSMTEIKKRIAARKIG